MNSTFKIIKIFKSNLQPPEKIEKEKRIINYEKGTVLGTTKEINEKVKKEFSKKLSFEDIEELWNTGILECRGLAASALQKMKAQDSKKIRLIFSLVPTSYGWTDTDSLVVHQLKDLWRRNPVTAFSYAEKHLKSKNKWERRFSMVALIPLTSEKKYIPKILSLAEKLLKDPEQYVQKAVSWAIKQGYTHSQDLIFEFLKKNAKTKDENQIKTIRLAMEYQSPQRKEELRKVLKIGKV